MNRTDEVTIEELYEDILSKVQVILNKKSEQKLNMISQGRNNGIEYAALINEIDMLEKFKANLMIYMD